MLHFRQCTPPPTGVLPQASQGIDKSTIETHNQQLFKKEALKLHLSRVESLLKVIITPNHQS
jgi:hypothetical protein